MKSIREHLPTGLFLASLGLFITVACNSSSSSNNGGNTSTTTTQIDRVGLPAVNTALVAAARKDDFNLGDPRTDTTNFRAEILANIQGLRTAVNGINGFPPQDNAVPADVLTGIVCPDILTVDFSRPTVFPNGRGLPDDVIDVILGLVLDRANGGLGIPDGINANDRAFLATFPYLADPQ